MLIAITIYLFIFLLIMRSLKKRLRCSDWWNNLERKQQHKYAIFFVLPCLTILFARRAWRAIYREEWKLRAKEQREYEERRAREDKEISDENIRRAKLREEYFQEHPPKLYYCTVNGVTAVLAPFWCETAKRQTEAALIDEVWFDENMFFTTVIYPFATEKGLEVVKKNIKSAGLSQEYKSHRLMSDLHKLAEQSGCTLEKAIIFVPLANEAKMSFREQAERNLCRKSGWSLSDLRDLIIKQAPEEMRPVSDNLMTVESGNVKITSTNSEEGLMTFEHQEKQ